MNSSQNESDFKTRVIGYVETLYSHWRIEKDEFDSTSLQQIITLEADNCRLVAIREYGSGPSGYDEGLELGPLKSKLLEPVYSVQCRLGLYAYSRSLAEDFSWITNHKITLNNLLNLSTWLNIDRIWGRLNSVFVVLNEQYFGKSWQNPEFELSSFVENRIKAVNPIQARLAESGLGNLSSVADKMCAALGHLVRIETSPTEVVCVGKKLILVLKVEGGSMIACLRMEFQQFFARDIPIEKLANLCFGSSVNDSLEHQLELVIKYRDALEEMSSPANQPEIASFLVEIANATMECRTLVELPRTIYFDESFR